VHHEEYIIIVSQKRDNKEEESHLLSNKLLKMSKHTYMSFRLHLPNDISDSEEKNVRNNFVNSR
jgi:hypothetical protein